MTYGGKTHEQLSKIMVEVSFQQFYVFPCVLHCLYIYYLEEFESVCNLTKKSGTLQDHIWEGKYTSLYIYDIAYKPIKCFISMAWLTSILKCKLIGYSSGTMGYDRN